MAECSGSDDYSKFSKLDYSIHSYSSYSTTYVPENIKVDKCRDQSSRWSSDSNFPPQYLILKLSTPAIVKSITFGKFEKTHVCNLKKFKIFGGLDESTTVELLDWGLKNDSSPETFKLKSTLGDKEFPCIYIKIEPFQSWGPSFNFSIWYVELCGVDEYERVFNAAKWFEQYRNLEITKLCMKYFRQKNNLELYNLLLKSTNISMEHPLLTELFNKLVNEGDFEKVEEIMTNFMHNDHLLNCYLSQQDYEPQWTCFAFDNSPSPGRRGGHQMCLDPQSETIYLLGGWNGNEDLSDFWKYSVKERRWTRICANVENVGGPTPRSCHKLCLDPERRQIFVLGRYLEQTLRQPEFLKSDFFVYDIDSNVWTVISLDTASVGGPRLIFDHQMCLDSKTSKIYVFGGRVLTPVSAGQPEESGLLDPNNQRQTSPPVVAEGAGAGSSSSSASVVDSSAADRIEQINNALGLSIPINNNNLSLIGGLGAPVSSGGGGNVVTTSTTGVANSSSASMWMPQSQEQTFSGLFAYHIPTNSWEEISLSQKSKAIQSRAGHSMLFHPELRKLFIFAGQRNKEYLNDFVTFNVDTYEIEFIQVDIKNKKDSSNPGLPASGFTRRATIDPVLNEIYVLSGLSKEKEKRDETVQNSFWVYEISKNQWSCVYRNENCGEQYWNKMHTVEPCPRFAHQLVYDTVNKVHYLFGGNPGKTCSPRLRLDDFWQLTLSRPTREHVLRKCKILIRKCKFQELALDDKFCALKYLQTSLSELINHEDKEQSHEFRSLAQHLFIERSDDRVTYLNIKQSSSSHLSDVTQKRNQLYETLIEFFPDHMTQPKRNLQNLISF